MTTAQLPHADLTGAEALVAALHDAGVRVVFGLPGVHNLSIWHALAGSGIRMVGVRHEQTAAYAADGYARTTGQLGVAVVTTGPGAANTVAGVGEAMASASPILVIATDIPTTQRRPGVYRGVVHECRDQEGLFRPVTKDSATVADPRDIARHARDLAAAAVRPQSGPVYLGIPYDLLSWRGPQRPGVPESWRPPSPPVDGLRQAAQLLAEARRPLLWAGGGAARSGAGPAIASLSERVHAPVITTFASRGLVPPDHPGHVAGPIHSPRIGALWDQADLVVAVGADFDGITTQNWLMPPPARLVAINIDGADAAKNYTPDLLVVADAREAVEALLEQVPPRSPDPGSAEELGAINAAVRRDIAEEEPQAARLMDVLRRTQPDNTSYFADMCIAGYWLAGFLTLPSPRLLAHPMGWGTLGYAFPAALGAAAAGAGRVVCVVGDGGFLFACGELATAKQEDLDVTVVLVDDGGYGMLRYDQEHAGVDPLGVALDSPDFVALAECFGVPAVRVDGFDADFEQALAQASRRSGPSVVVVHARLHPPVSASPLWYRKNTVTAMEVS